MALTLDGTMVPGDLADLVAIQQCLSRAALGNDLLDAALWKSAYWPDGTEDHGWYQGNAHAFIDQTVPMLEQQMETTWHAMALPAVTIDGYTARAITCFTAYVRFKPDAEGKSNDLISGGRYVDRLERRDGHWRITARISKGDWIRVDPASYEWGQPGLGGHVPQMGMRAPDDPGRQMLEEMGWAPG